MTVKTSEEKILDGKSNNLPKKFTAIYVPYVKKLLEYSPKNRLDIYKFSAAYFEDKLKKRQRMFEYDSSKDFCRKNKLNETLEVEEKSKNPSLRTIPLEADFIYDSVVKIHPMDKKFTREENTRIDNKNSVKGKKVEVMGYNSELGLRQIQTLNSAIATLYLDCVHVLQDVIHCKMNVEESDDTLPPDFQFKKTTKTDENFHKITNINEEVVYRTELKNLSQREEELEKTAECVCSVLSTTAKLKKNSDEQSNIAKCPRCTGASMTEYITNSVKLATELINSIKRTIELKGLNYKPAFNAQNSQFRIIPTVLQDPPYSITGFEYKASPPKADDLKLQLSNEKVSDSKEREMCEEPSVICSEKKDSKLFSKYHKVKKRVISSSQKEITLKGIYEEDIMTKLSKTEQSSVEQNGRIFDFSPFPLDSQKLADTHNLPETIEKFHKERTVNSPTETEQTLNTSPSALTLEKSSITCLQPNEIENNLVATDQVKGNQKASTIIKYDTWIRDGWISSKLDSKIETSYPENSIMTKVMIVPTNLSCRFKQRNIQLPHTLGIWKYFVLKRF